MKLLLSFVSFASLTQAGELTVSPGEQLGEGYRPTNAPGEFGRPPLDGTGKAPGEFKDSHLDGNQAIVIHSPAGSTATSAHVFVKRATGWEHEASLSDLVTYEDDTDRAQVVKIDGDFALVGANGVGLRRVVHAFQRIGGVWNYLETLRRWDAGDFGDFGFAIDLEDGTAIIASFEYDVTPDSLGFVYCYAWEAGSWKLIQTIRGLSQVYAIGSDVDLDGDQMVVGNFKRVGLFTGPDNRLNYYTRDSNGRWQERQRIGADGGNEYFGQRAKLSGNWLAIRTRGGIELHENGPGGWEFRQEIAFPIYPDNNAGFDPLDGAFDLKGDHFFVEMPHDGERRSGDLRWEISFREFAEFPDGVVHHYRRNGDLWELVDLLDPVEGGRGHGSFSDFNNSQGRFAQSISYSEGRCLINDRMYEKNALDRWTQSDVLNVIDGLDNPAAFETFGYSVSISGNLAVVGAPRQDAGGVAFGGVVHTFVKGPDGWKRGAEITAPNAAIGDRFGNAVKLHGTSLVVGAPRTDRLGRVNLGSGYLFTRSGDDWVLESELLPPPTGEREQFGTSVGISGNYIALGGCFADPGGNDSAGAVAVFDRASLLSPATMITALGGSAGDQFGRSVDIHDDHLFVGAPFHGILEPRPAGSVFIFERSQGGWLQSAVIEGQGGGERFGWSLSADPPYLVVGSPAYGRPDFADSSWAVGAGSIYEKRQAGWILVNRTGYSGSLIDSRPPPLFGKSVDISGERAVFSSEYRHSFTSLSGGGATVYDLADGTWTRGAVYGSDRVTSVAIDGVNLVSSFPHERFEEPKSLRTVGSAKFFDLSEPEPVLPQSFSAFDPALLAGWALTIWGNTAMVAADYQDDSFGLDPGKVFVYARDPSGWQQTAALSLPDNTPYFDVKIAHHGDTAVLGNGAEAHIYVKDGLTWQIQQTIDTDAVAVHGNRIVTSSGEIYRRSARLAWEYVATLPVSENIEEIALNENWVALSVSENRQCRLELFRLDKSDSVLRTASFPVGGIGSFPCRLALGEDLVVVTDPAGGTVYYSTLGGDGWSPLAEVPSTNRSGNDHFGSSLAISDGMILVGAQKGGSALTGQCHLLRWDGTSWQDETIVEEPDAVVGGQFGRSADFSAGLALVGSAGRAHVFEIVGPGDLDGDGLPDSWEDQFALSTTDTSLEHTGFGNPDGDRWSNLEEYLLGTDPRSPEPPSQLLPISILNEDGESLGSAPTHDFGNIARGSSASTTLQIRNNSTVEIQFLVPSFGVHSSEFTSDLTGEVTLPPGGIVSMSVTFAPRVPETFTAEIPISTGSADPAPLTIAVTGTSTEPPLGFEPDYAPEVYGNVRCLCIQPDGKVLIGGQWFRTGTDRTSLFVARLNSDGSLDDSFVAQLPDAAYQGNFSGVNCLAVQDDGRILLGGAFGREDGTVGPGIFRLESDGTLDTGFSSPIRPIIGLGSSLYALSIGAEGDILAGGTFMLDDGTFNRLVRLKPDGRRDPDFLSAPNSEVEEVVHQEDGKILILGRFGSVNGISQPYIARLEPNGGLDQSFRVSVNSPLDAMALSSGGQLVFGGNFTTVNGVARPHVARMSPTGVIDPTFSSLPGSRVGALAIQANGGIFMASSWRADTFDFGDHTGEHIARVHSDGGYDPDFPSHVSLAGIRSMSLDANGKLLFIKYPFKGPLRAHAGPVTDTLSLSPDSTLTWLRGGALPETQQVKFRISLDEGNSWSQLGNGTRVAGGWELATAGLPPGSLISATARVENGSSSLVGSRSSVRVPSDGLTAIERWRLQHYGSSENSGPGADDHAPSGDGITNFMLFATGHPPTSPAGAIVAIRRVGDEVELTYQRSATALQSGVSFTLETSTELTPGSWEELNAPGIVNDVNATTAVVVHTVPGIPYSQRFFRLKVTSADNP